MNIVFAVDGMGFGGAERVISILANEFVKKGYSVTITQISGEKTQSAYSLDKSIRYDWIESHSYSSYRDIKNLNIKLEEYFLKVRPDIVISFLHIVCAKCIYPCKKLRIPLIYSERNDPSNYFKTIKSKIYQIYLRNNIKYVVFQTNGAKNLYPKRLHSASTIIFNPADYSCYPPCFEGQRKKEIVTVGRLTEQKNQQLLIRAFGILSQRFPEYSLKIYGEGKLHNEFEKMIDDLGMTDKVLLMGTTQDILNKINGAALFVFTSNYEGLPNALIEAMSLGLPCISTKCSPGGAEEIIDDRINGLLVECDDCDDLVEKMEFLLKNENVALEMGKKAMGIRKRIQIDTIVAKWEYYIDGVIKNKQDKKS